MSASAPPVPLVSRPLAASGPAAQAYRTVRDFTARLVAPLEPEDMVIQPMPDASPAKWHLAHTTWFFEEFLLPKLDPSYRAFHPDFSYLFNSYYVQVGKRWVRHERGLLSRPTVAEVMEYRAHVDAAVERALRARGGALTPEAADVLAIGLNHEQQHQELLITDIKYTLSRNPLFPRYHAGSGGGRAKRIAEKNDRLAPDFIEHDAGLREIGIDAANHQFSYDNESPHHQVYVPAFALGSRPITNGQWLEFIADGGYERAELWLSMGWAARQAGSWEAPLYWHAGEEGSGTWNEFTLDGLQPLDEAAPAAHISYFEADAYARWAGAILPTEAMWEVAAAPYHPAQGQFADDFSLHPQPLPAPAADAALQGLFGSVWEWTQSPYTAYPGFAPPAGALGEYNGKFMCNQFVLRGGSCVTPAGHVRLTYRNFFPPEARWQFSGMRLAKLL